MLLLHPWGYLVTLVIVVHKVVSWVKLLLTSSQQPLLAPSGAVKAGSKEASWSVPTWFLRVLWTKYVGSSTVVLSIKFCCSAKRRSNSLCLCVCLSSVCNIHTSHIHTYTHISYDDSLSSICIHSCVCTSTHHTYIHLMFTQLGFCMYTLMCVHTSHTHTYLHISDVDLAFIPIRQPGLFLLIWTINNWGH